MSYLPLLFFIVAIGGLIVIFAPSVASAYQTFKNSKEEKEKSDEKQKQREDEGIFVTAGRIILGDKLLDDAIAEEKKRKELEQSQRDTHNYLVQVYGEGPNAIKQNPKYKNKIIVTDSEREKLGIPLSEELTADSYLAYKNAYAKKQSSRRIR